MIIIFKKLFGQIQHCGGEMTLSVQITIAPSDPPLHHQGVGSRSLTWDPICGLLSKLNILKKSSVSIFSVFEVI